MWIDLKSKFLKLWDENGFARLVAWAESDQLAFERVTQDRKKHHWLHRCEEGGVMMLPARIGSEA